MSDIVGRASERDPWADIVGPCCSWAAMKREVGFDSAMLAKAVDDLRALQLTTSDGVKVFPIWQVSDGALVPGLELVLRELRTGLHHPWTWAQWLSIDLPEDGRSRADALLKGEIYQVVIEARQAATAWMQ